MPRRAPALVFAVTWALLLGCASGGSGGEGSGGQGANGGFMASGGTAGSGTGGRLSSGGSSAGGRSSTGGVTANAGLGGSVTGGQSTGGSSASGGTSGSSTGGRSSTGGVTASGGRGGSGAGGESSSGGSSASGAGGVSSAGGAQNSGGAGASGAAGTGGTGSFAQCPDTTWKLVWGDDFDGASGTAVDGSKWAYDSGPNWYNGELQAYTTGTTNASLDGSGNLVIEARKESREGREYTSARLKTEGKKTFTYGRFEGRMKLPYGQGIWPAFWMLGGNSWPNTGEIDIMENLGREPSIAYGTIHGPGYSGAAGPSASYTLPGGAVFSDAFHLFAIEWEANAIRWYVDGDLYSTKTAADINGNDWVFDHGFFFILNVAVGGDWPGDPNETTVFPQKMLIDYVHVCEK